MEPTLLQWFVDCSADWAWVGQCQNDIPPEQCNMQKCPHPSGFILGGKAGFISVYEETSEPAEPFLVVREDLYAWYIYMSLLFCAREYVCM